MTDRHEERRGGAGPRAIAQTVARITAGPLGRRGLAQAALVAGWAEIVGRELADVSLPLAISFSAGARAGGTLRVRVASGAAALEMQHRERQVLERINGHFGYAAVARLAITQGPLPRGRSRRAAIPAREPSPAAQAALEKQVETVADPELRIALYRLGRRLAAER